MERRRMNVGDRVIDVEVYLPENRLSGPGILLLHEILGLRNCYREDAIDLASRGYLVYLPDLFTDGVLRYCIRAMIFEAGRKNKSSNKQNVEIHKLLDYLKTDTNSNGRLGMLGACLTGGFVLHMAQREDMLAPVVYHHSLGSEGAGVPDNENLDDIRILQGHWSTIDPFCPAKRRKRLAADLGSRLEAYTYNMPHGFRSTSRRLSGSKKVWKRTIEFFDQNLKD